jgi:hypothetical protein
MFLCMSRFDLEEEAKLLEKYFFHDEIEAAKEEKDEKLDEVEVEPISDTEKQETIVEDEALSTQVEQQTISGSQLPLPGNNIQVRASRRKRKSRDDDLFEYH